MKRTCFVKMLSLFVTVALVCAMLTVGAPAVSAATPVPSIAAGEAWSAGWSASQEYAFLDLDIQESGLYTLTITDRMQTGMTFVNVFDATDDWYIGYIEETVGAVPYVSEMIVLKENHDYSLEISYYDDDGEHTAADMTIRLDKVELTPTLLPNGAVNSSKVMIDLEMDESEWLRYVPASSGDYTLNFSASIGAWVDLYDAADFNMLESRDTQYWDYGEWVNGYCASFYLEAGKEYYFCVGNYDSHVTSRVSMTKNDKSIEYIALGDPVQEIDCYIGGSAWTDIMCYFDYQVYYRDGSFDTVSYDVLSRRGVEMPDVYYEGDMVYPNEEELLVAGNRPVVAYYKDIVVSYATIPVTSMTDWLIDIDAGPVGEKEGCYFTNSGIADDIGYYRIKVAKTGLYEMYSSDWDYLSDFSLVFLDAQNNPVEYYREGYPLVAGQEYALSFRCTYAEDVTDEFEFELRCETTKLFPDTAAGAWYNDAVAHSVGRGILSGYKSGNFGTADGIQRQDFLVMLARFDGVDLEGYYLDGGQFPDVARGSYYEAAVAWGYENGIVTGYNSGRFGVGNKITREQLVTFIQRYAAYKGYDTSTDPSVQSAISKTYKDYKNVGAFAKDAMLWAIDNGVLKGKAADRIAPQGNAQRCEVAQIMYNIFVNDVL